MWLVIPGIIVGIGVLVALIAKFWSDEDVKDFCWVTGVVLALCLLLAMIFCPCVYYESRNDALKAEAYYQQIVLPNVIEEHDNYVVVESLEAGIWQMGGLPAYNSYIRTTRHWDSIPIIGSCVYSVPSQLKYVRISTK